MKFDKIKIGIHHRPGSFSDQWIEYCVEKNLDYKIVNAFQDDIIDQLEGCNLFMWHYHHKHIKDSLTAKRILFSLEHAGIKVFPNFNTAWHFDDKVAQKYLLESINAPLVRSYIFYDKKEALDWSRNTAFPKVFKLKGGAGASNVQLVKSRVHAKKLINKSFGRGFSQFNRVENLRNRFKKYRSGQDTALGVIKAIARVFISTEYARKKELDKGYAYFQDFIPSNDFDIRIIVIGDRAYGLKRLVRDNDFRASGSGKLEYNHNEIDLRCIEVAFKINKKLKTQSIAFDFIFDEKNNPLIVEISYGFAPDAYDKCPGFWDKDCNFIEGSFNPQYWMIENLISSVKSS